MRYAELRSTDEYLEVFFHWKRSARIGAWANVVPASSSSPRHRPTAISSRRARIFVRRQHRHGPVDRQRTRLRAQHEGDRGLRAGIL